MVSAQLTDWLIKQYPSPKIDPEWLQGCYEWVTSQPDSTSFDKISHQVDWQLLESDLSDSMLPGTGIPQSIIRDSEQRPCTIKGPVLVQIHSITDIGVSAWNLEKTRQVREDRERSGAQDAGAGDDDVDLDIEGEGPIPPYTRSMLRFELSDGFTALKAIEYKKIPQLVLGETPLGYKMLLKNTLVRRGIALLEPENIILKAHRNADRDANQRMDFKQSLRARMGLPPLQDEHVDMQEHERPPAPGQPMPLPANPAPILSPRRPLHEISPPPVEQNERAHDDTVPPRRKHPPAPATTARTNGITRELSPIDISSDSEVETRTSKQAARPATPGDEFADDGWDDPAFLEAVGQLEMENQMQPPKPVGPEATRSETIVTRNVQQSDTDVHIISSDSEDEKENVPASRRLVRRKIDEDIIELSD